MKRTHLFLLVVLIAVRAIGVRAQDAPNTIPGANSPFSAPQLYQSASAAFQAGDFERAILESSLYLVLNPTHNRGYFLRAISYTQLDDAENALIDLDRTLDLTDPETDADLAAQALQIRGSLYRTQQNYEAALTDFDESIRLSPSDTTYFARALTHRAMDNLEAARDDLTEAIALAPEDPFYPLYRGTLYNRLGSFSDGAQDFARYIELVEESRTDADPLVAGEPVEVEIELGVTFAFPFDAQRGDQITALAVTTDDSDVDPLIVLLDPSGDPLVGDDDGTGTLGSFFTDFELPRTGTYTLLVTSAPARVTGAAQIGIELLTP